MFDEHGYLLKQQNAKESHRRHHASWDLPFDLPPMIDPIVVIKVHR